MTEKIEIKIYRIKGTKSKEIKLGYALYRFETEEKIIDIIEFLNSKMDGQILEGYLQLLRAKVERDSL